MNCPKCQSKYISYIMEGTFSIISENPDYPELSEFRYGNIHDVAETFKDYKVVKCICKTCDHTWELKK